MKFEWDDDKYEENIRKHGIPFEYAALKIMTMSILIARIVMIS